MKTNRLVLPILLSPALLFILMRQPAHAGSATWNLNPATKLWNNPANWTPATVPKTPSDIATFDVSNLTAVTYEFLKEHRKVEGLEATAARQQATNAEQQKEIEALTAALKAQAVQIQQVRDQLRTQASAPRVVANNQ